MSRQTVCAFFRNPGVRCSKSPSLPAAPNKRSYRCCAGRRKNTTEASTELWSWLELPKRWHMIRRSEGKHWFSSSEGRLLLQGHCLQRAYSPRLPSSSSYYWGATVRTGDGAQWAWVWFLQGIRKASCNSQRLGYSTYIFHDHSQSFFYLCSFSE